MDTDDKKLYQMVLEGMTQVSDAQVDTALSDAAKAFLATEPDEESAKRWLHEARDYMVRYSWTSGFWITAVGSVIGDGRSHPPPPEGDDFEAWRKRWETV